MEIEVSAFVRAPRERVWAWWTDFGEPGTEQMVDHGMGRSRRLILSRKGNSIEMEERVGPLVVARRGVVVDAAAYRLREAGHPPLTHDTDWFFEEKDGGTLIRRVFRPRALLVRATPAFMTRAGIRRDLEHHAREAERDLTG